ncbi:D-alanine--poly(phosphoribitol) ligase subunit DltA [Neobacillus drentensis]|uniref:D-alanine--poly(phosphoribitol) ligase subunit DltA n=1 Tax=Neobacillus drentensis TaxID=220684 RepID=UPI00300043D8
MNFYSQLQKWSELYPEKTVFSCGNESLTYRQLYNMSESLAYFLDNLLLDDSTPIVVYGHMEPLMLVCFLACVKSGHPYIPVDTSIPDERIAKIIEDSGAKMMLSPIDLPQVGLEHLSHPLNGDRLRDALVKNQGKTISSESYVLNDENFYIIYTSGSTGNPKGVQISYNNLMSFTHWMTNDFGLANHQVFLNQAPFSFDLSVMDLFPSLFLGGTLWMLPKEYVAAPKELFLSLEKSSANIWTSTPSFVDYCLSDEQFSASILPELTTFLFCGEALPSATALKLRKRFPNATVFNTYGPTECTVAATSITVDNSLIEKYESLPIGISKKDGEVYILSESLDEQPDGEKGQIVITGPHVSKGYLNQPGLTRKSFFVLNGQPAYKTGDLGYKKDGLLFYAGRMDFQVKVNGYRMELEEIEAQLSSLPLVQNVMIVPNYKDGKCEFLTAVIVPASHKFEKEFQLTSQLKKELRALLPQYMVPRKFVYRPALPMTNNGKVDRKRVLHEVTA